MQEHINGALPSAEDYEAFAVAVEELTAGVNPDDTQLLSDVLVAARQSVDVENNPVAGPDDYLTARAGIRDSLSALRDKCAAEGSSALS
ncbi:hypothetical protein [Aeromicrobium sp. UC242_57]|uniref:hypothetical protein n=1 Tax=Aeromicrobium sp. UC242_57 TaxID=3374624 RepID=UPI0037A1A25F